MQGRKLYIFVFLFAAFQCLQAQSLRVKNFANHQLIKDTVYIQSTDNGGWVGAESLDIRLIVENMGMTTIEVGARKIEHEKLQSDVEHTICFAGQCYDTGTFESTFHLTMSTGTSDSLFTGHYLFDNKVHIRGINHISYLFYDVNNPSDSIVVNVIYNTVVALGVKDYNKILLNVFPIPAKEQISLSGLPPQKTTVILYDLQGRKIYYAQTNGEVLYTIPVSGFANGMYVMDVDGQMMRVLVE